MSQQVETKGNIVDVTSIDAMTSVDTRKSLYESNEVTPHDCKEFDKKCKECLIELEAKHMSDQQEKALKDMNRKAETNLLDIIKFKSKEDKQIFDKLPISEYDKEQIIKDMVVNYNLNKDD